MNEHEFEPVRGLPELLPAGEEVIWRCEPDWQSLARRVFHVRKVALYFALILAYSIGDKWLSGAPLADVVSSSTWQLTLAAATLAILYYLAWLYARTTVYTITSERLVMRFGVALTMVITIPWSKIVKVDLLNHGDGTGDLAFTVDPEKRMSYLLLWPQVRPWRFAPVTPSIRCIAEPEKLANKLADTLHKRMPEAASTAQSETPPVMHGASPTATAT